MNLTIYDIYLNWAKTTLFGQSYVKNGGVRWWEDYRVPKRLPYGGVRWKELYYSSSDWDGRMLKLDAFGDVCNGKWQYYEKQGFSFEKENDFMKFVLIMSDEISNET